jgi:hypothetical protein
LTITDVMSSCCGSPTPKERAAFVDPRGDLTSESHTE